MNYCVCICTYKRVNLLALLIEDLLKQTTKPEIIIVIDGYPDNKEVIDLIITRFAKNDLRFIYLPSNHSNLSYQRYLGWKVATNYKTDLLLYLDDDLRINQSNAIEQMMHAFITDTSVVGVTSRIKMGELGEQFRAHRILQDRNKDSRQKKKSIAIDLPAVLIYKQPGGLTPSGDRILPIINEGISEFLEVQWLRGGVMMYKMSAINAECFLEDLFAVDHIRCGKGEDTILSRRVMSRGKLLFASHVTIDHPNADLPKTYPISAYKLGYSTAYSRRFLNDHYRVNSKPFILDRLFLAKTYLGNNLINLYNALLHPEAHRFSYLCGYFWGTITGIFIKPTSKKLSPDVDWWRDAEDAYEKIQVLFE